MLRWALLFWVLAAAVLAGSGCNVALLQTATLVDTDSAISSGNTGHFVAPGTWAVKTSYDCSRQDSEGVLNTNHMTIRVYNADDDSLSFEHPLTTLKGRSGKRVLTFKRGGPFYITVESACDWNLQVIDRSGA